MSVEAARSLREQGAETLICDMIRIECLLLVQGDTMVVCLKHLALASSLSLYAPISSWLVVEQCNLSNLDRVTICFVFLRST